MSYNSYLALFLLIKPKETPCDTYKASVYSSCFFIITYLLINYLKDGLYCWSMKIVVLAAGKGVRMLPLTNDVPKVLVKVGGKPFLHYVFESIIEAGFDDIGIIVGYKKEKIKEFLVEYGYDATLIEQKEQKGTGDAIKCVKAFVGEENFAIATGDDLVSVADLKQFKTDDNYCYIAGLKVEDPSKYGVLVCADDKLVRIAEKPQEFVGNLINAGYYKFTKDIFSALDKITISPRGEYELTDAISLLAQEGKVKVIPLKDYWHDLGCKDDIPKIERFLESTHSA